MATNFIVLQRSSSSRCMFNSWYSLIYLYFSRSAEASDDDGDLEGELNGLLTIFFASSVLWACFSFTSWINPTTGRTKRESVNARQTNISKKEEDLAHFSTLQPRMLFEDPLSAKSVAALFINLRNLLLILLLANSKLVSIASDSMFSASLKRYPSNSTTQVRLAFFYTICLSSAQSWRWFENISRAYRTHSIPFFWMEETLCCQKPKRRPRYRLVPTPPVADVETWRRNMSWWD